MRNQLWGWGLALGLLSGGSVRAITYQDVNEANVWLNGLNTSYTGQFDIASEGFDPLTQTLDSATAYFTLWDAFSGESWEVTLEGDSFVTGDRFQGFIDVGGSLSGSLLLELADDGLLNYTVARSSGEFWLTEAWVVGEASPRPLIGGEHPHLDSPAVPDGGTTLALLGTGLLGVAALRRRRA